MIFIDSDAYIALHSKNDSHHKKASKLRKLLQERKEDLITSWDVIDEVSTKLSYFGTKELSLKFLDEIKKSRVIVIFPDNQLLKKVINIFKKQKSKRVSFTDCVNMAVAKQRNIDTFFSFDQHYVKNGFKLLRAEK